MKTVRIAIGQINPELHALERNLALCLRFVELANQHKADILLLPANSLFGADNAKYLQQPGLVIRYQQALEALHQAAGKLQIQLIDQLQTLTAPSSSQPLVQAVYQRQNFLLTNPEAEFTDLPSHDAGLPLIVLNQVGAAGERLATGASCVFDAAGKQLGRAKQFEQDLLLLDCVAPEGAMSYQLRQIEMPTDLKFGFGERENPDLQLWQALTQADNTHAKIYQALLLGLKDFINKAGFNQVLLGLSGGIDSALVLALAVDALGAARVESLMMPFHYTAQISLEDAKLQAQMLGVEYNSLPIVDIYQQFEQTLAPKLAGYPELATDTTYENLQARIRGLILMTLSNRANKLVLTTSNKSELAVGYTTLHGDMVGGFAPLKDVPKTLVYQLANFRNTLSPAIPERVITRPPSAELRADQQDQDSLPDYDLLDAIIDLFVEQNLPPEQIANQLNADLAEVKRITRMIAGADFKRKLAAPGLVIHQYGFGTDYQNPIALKD